ncbi:hypothetical protein [Gillisia hiemivivida]|uniref:Uncharacterized protein n=1 Tax=Gillisia hiemivivida TaxID=291190 RepID=A0A5C6ZTB7_9FLAO|nr:hypothetical protein [Gillisia hiemivivida]TXD93955.1 hypothetical protein ES724_08520 [Gillisia hiemivivida]
MVSLTSCRDTKKETTEEHGHEHDAGGGHLQDENVEQEEFQVGKDTLKAKTETHKHGDDAEHHDH